MQEEQNIQNQQPAPTATQQKPQKNGLVTLLSGGLILASITAGFFAWQTQKLVIQIREMQQETQTPTPTSSPTVEDTTKNWKTYKNSQYGYQLNIPQTWTTKEEYSSVNSQLNPENKIQAVTLSDPNTSIKIYYEGDWDHGFEPWVTVLNEKTVLGDKSAQLVVLKQNENDDPSNGWAIYSNIPSIPNFRIETTYTEEVRQILSTFKFLEDTKSPQPTP